MKIKMNIRYSVFLSASCILVFSRIAFAADLFTCKLPHNFTLKMSNSQKVHLYESDLTVRLENDALTLTSYTGTNSINIQANDVIVSFNGFMYTEYEDPMRGISMEPQIMSKTYTDRISGVMQRGVLDSSDIHGCRIILLSTETKRSGMVGRIANEIHRLAESCIELELCQKISTMKPEFMTTMPGESVSDLLSACPDPLVIVTKGCETYYNTDTVQPIMNKVVDIGLAQITEQLGSTDGGTFSVPNIDKDFSIGSSIFKTKGYFKAVNGTFRDLTTIRRMSDMSLSHDGMKLMAACELGLDIAYLNYPHYEVKYGIIKVNGKLSGSVNGTALVIRVAVDYNRKPCRLSMEHLKVMELGNMNIELTGLGPLNWMMSKLLNWITTTWREDIVVTLEQELRASVENNLVSFDCERYRP